MTDELTHKQLMAEHIATQFEKYEVGYDASMAELMKLGYNEDQADKILFHAANNFSLPKVK